MLLARDAELTLAYSDLVRASFGAPLHIRALRAAELDGRLERQADGKASWQFGAKTNIPDEAEPPARLPWLPRHARPRRTWVTRRKLPRAVPPV